MNSTITTTTTATKTESKPGINADGLPDRIATMSEIISGLSVSLNEDMAKGVTTKEKLLAEISAVFRQWSTLTFDAKGDILPSPMEIAENSQRVNEAGITRYVSLYRAAITKNYTRELTGTYRGEKCVITTGSERQTVYCDTESGAFVGIPYPEYLELIGTGDITIDPDFSDQPMSEETNNVAEKVDLPAPDANAFTGEVLSFDIYGPEHTPSREGYKYYAVVIDEYSGYRFILFLRKRSHFYDEFASLYNHIERQTGNGIKRIRSDNAKEFINLSTELVARGVIMEHSLPHIHQQNGRAEASIRHINDQARAMLLHHDIPIEFWADAVNHTTVLHNALFISQGSTVTAYERFYGSPYPLDPQYIFQQFGSDCTYLLPPPNRSTPENGKHKSIKAPHGEAGIYLGHSAIGYSQGTSKSAMVYSVRFHIDI